MASTRSTAGTFTVLFILAVASLELVSGRPFDPFFSDSQPSTASLRNPTTPLPSIAPRGDATWFSLLRSRVSPFFSHSHEDLAAHVHQAHVRALPNDQNGLTTREKLIIGLSAGLGGLFILLSVLLAVVGYRKGWHRRRSSKRTSNDQRRTTQRSVPEDTFQRHHESMLSIGTPRPDLRVSYDSETTLCQTCPYHPGLPSPMTSYYQPVEVYRTLMQANKQTHQPIAPIAPAALSPAIHPAHYSYRPSYNPQHFQCDVHPPTPSDSEISPRTVPPQSRYVLHAPQPRRVGLPPSVRSGVGMGLALPPPPPLPSPAAAKLRPLPLRDYSETH
ncbi:hypothetical protein PRK78_004701 [Emydomyces testavorans]|uniref:Uncharacterized protein n=1 Tax=Emydomyces testavorans TaxID=2070801 RepID=A0AAF0IJU5_9EURO|nr:hypothetical protein PRK78_004701 [Emydomyces testavorans]